MALTLMRQIAILFIMMGCGYFLVRCKLLKSEDSRVLSVILIYIVLPCVIIRAFQIDFTPEVRDGFMMALAAAVLMAEPEYASQVRQLAKNLDLFEFVPGVASPEAYAKFMIKESGRYDYDENLDAFYDYRRYGELRVAEEQGQFTDLGYVCYKGTMSLDELMMEDPAEQYQREQKEEQGQTMGGLT